MNQKLLSKLQQKIEGMSFNSLRRIYPEQLEEWSECSMYEWKSFIQELIEARLITFKYDFDCICGNHCTVYWNKVAGKVYQCLICGEEYNDKKIESIGTLVYEINKKEFLEYEQGEIDYKKLVRDTRKVVPISSDISVEENTMSKKKIFIGSSTTVIKKMEEIARIIDDLGGEAVPWNKKGLFVAGQYTFQSLVKIAKKVDGAIFMFNAEDATWYSDRCELKKEVRDNVLLEYGLFAGILGPDKVTFICENSPKIATDLLGITYIKGNQTEYQIKPDIEAWMNQL